MYHPDHSCTLCKNIFPLPQVFFKKKTFFFVFQDSLLRAVKTSKIQQTGVQPTIKPHKWSYASAFLYSLTLITTIGEYISFYIVIILLHSHQSWCICELFKINKLMNVSHLSRFIHLIWLKLKEQSKEMGTFMLK